MTTYGGYHLSWGVCIVLMRKGELRMKRLVFGASLLLVLLITACSRVSGNVEVGYEAPPVQFSATFSIHPDGSVSVGGSVGLVTEIGIFSVGANIEANTQPAPDETLLFIRHRVKRGVVDTAYRIGTGEDVTVVIDGLTTINVANHKVTIDASKGKIKEITIHNTVEPAPTQQSQPPSSNLRLVRSIQSSTVSIRTLSWSPDSQLIADGGTTGEANATVVEIRRASDGALVSTHGGFTVVQYISWSPNGTLIAAVEQASYARIWDASSGQTTASLNDNWIGEVSWSPDSRYVVTSGGDYPIVWNAATGAQINSYSSNLYVGQGTPAAWAPHGDLISGGGVIWDAMSGTLVQKLNGLNPDQYNGYNIFSWSPDARSIVSADATDVVDWDTSTGATIWDVSVPSNVVDLLSWSPDGKYIAWTDDSGGAGILYASSGRSAGSFGLSDGNAISSLAWSPDGRYIATASGGSIHLWAAPG
jgi:WD40 repeat protein